LSSLIANLNSACVLIVDDDEDVRHIMKHYLKKLDLHYQEASNGGDVLDILNNHPIDLIILDIMMPGITGIEVLTEVKNNPTHKHIPVIMCSAINRPESIVECLQLGAEDYVPKPFEKTIFQARVNGCVQRTLAHNREAALLTLLNDEINEAREYVATRLPAPIQTPLEIDHAYISSTTLGGDTFGFREIGDDHFVLFLADVSGHGIGSALYAASINDFLKHSLGTQQCTSPAGVVKELNQRFKMEKRAGKYFTFWYAVYQLHSQKLTYICCGHPPALLKRGTELTKLSVGDMAITGIESDEYPVETINIQAGDELLIFSDGIYETKINGVHQSYKDFQNSLSQLKHWPADEVLEHIQAQQESDTFDDDVSLVHVTF
jgi:phosphoserine phosphatase RsbU/P